MTTKVIMDNFCLYGWKIPLEVVQKKNEEEIGELFVKLMWSGLGRIRTPDGALALGLPITALHGTSLNDARDMIYEAIKSIGFDPNKEDFDWFEGA